MGERPGSAPGLTGGATESMQEESVHKFQETANGTLDTENSSTKKPTCTLQNFKSGLLENGWGPGGTYNQSLNSPEDLFCQYLSYEEIYAPSVPRRLPDSQDCNILGLAGSKDPGQQVVEHNAAQMVKFTCSGHEPKNTQTLHTTVPQLSYDCKRTELQGLSLGESLMRQETGGKYKSEEFKEAHWAADQKPQTVTQVK